MNFNFEKQIYQLLESYQDQGKFGKGGGYNYVNESNLDSFELLNFISDVEDHFEVSLSPEELSHTDSQTVEGLARLIGSKLRKLG